MGSGADALAEAVIAEHAAAVEQSKAGYVAFIAPKSSGDALSDDEGVPACILPDPTEYSLVALSP